MTTALVTLWGQTVGEVTLDQGQTIARFRYSPEFLGSGLQVAPLMMPLSEQVYEFHDLNPATFRGLPGLLSDSLPDKFGTALIDRWLAMQDFGPEGLDAVGRLRLIGSRGMGALSFSPYLRRWGGQSGPFDARAFADLCSESAAPRQHSTNWISHAESLKAFEDLLCVGMVVGGARAKAVVAWDPENNVIRPIDRWTVAGPGHWLLKFDGVSGNKDKEQDDPTGYGVIEYVYYQMACRAGIEMSPCMLFEDQGRRHFLTQRFDRLDDDTRLHMQSLCAMAHFDFNDPDAYSYEQAFTTMHRLGLPHASLEAQFRRMAFNVVARNQDDHVKNIAFLMDQEGTWSLAPAFDVNFSYNPAGRWTGQHQMSINGKRDGFTHMDFEEAGKVASLEPGRAQEILEEVIRAVKNWTEMATSARVPEKDIERIGAAHRLEFA